MKYRQDNRTKEEFAENIKECSKIEESLISTYVADIILRTGKKYSWRAANDLAKGELVEKDSDVTSEADFIVAGPDGDVKTEIKFARKHDKVFRLKVSHLKSYIKQKATLVVFMGIEQSEPKYTVISTELMQKFIDTLPDKYFPAWKKDVKQIECKLLEWVKYET